MIVYLYQSYQMSIDWVDYFPSIVIETSFFIGYFPYLNIYILFINILSLIPSSPLYTQLI